MRKVLVMIAMAAMLIVGCGEKEASNNGLTLSDPNGTIEVEDIQTENIIVEDIQTEKH